MRWIAGLALLLISCGANPHPHVFSGEEALFRSFFERTVPVYTYCSGVPFARGTAVLLGGGRAVTAAHVVPAGCSARVEGKLAVAEKRDAAADVLVLRVDGIASPPMHYSSHYIGQEVFCVGYAYQMYTGQAAQQLTRGHVIVEYPGSLPGSGRLRVSCSFQKGASGGGVFDDRGNLIALITSVFEPMPNLPSVDQFIVSPSSNVNRLLNQ